MSFLLFFANLQHFGARLYSQSVHGWMGVLGVQCIALSGTPLFDTIFMFFNLIGAEKIAFFIGAEKMA
jgi:hypothetical protein